MEPGMRLVSRSHPLPLREGSGQYGTTENPVIDKCVKVGGAKTPTLKLLT